MVKPNRFVLPKWSTKGFLHQVRKFRVHRSDKDRVIEAFYAALDTPLSLSLCLLYRHGEFDQLVSKSIDPSQYIDMDDFRRDFAAVSFLRKNEVLKTTFDTKAAALTSFSEGELKCKATNERLRSYYTGKNRCPYEKTLNRAIRKISMILGDFSIVDVLDGAKWGPGSTLSVTGDDTSAAAKFDVDRDITSEAYELFGPVMAQAYPHWKAWDSVRFVESSKVLTVPKNALTDRTIAVEPGLNSWIQGGLGRLMRKRLRFAGFNLDSDLKNQRGAYIGSLDDSLATVDFSAASDSISTGVVELLLSQSPVWYRSLNAARTKLYSFKRNAGAFWSEKFSTMGNGFTFELESLIFVSIALAVCENRGVSTDAVCIFGDDLIIPSCCMSDLVQLCEWLGFTVNQKKSFSSGYFRESCGSYWFNGQDVKPIFLKKDLKDATQVYRLANSITRLASRFGGDYCRDKRFRSVWSLLVHLLPELLRLWGSATSGDGCIHVDFFDVDTPQPAPNGLEGFLHSSLVLEPVCIEKDSLGLLLARLLGAGSSELSYGNSTNLRGRTFMRLKRHMFVRQWYALGPWN